MEILGINFDNIDSWIWWIANKNTKKLGMILFS